MKQVSIHQIWWMLAKKSGFLFWIQAPKTTAFGLYKNLQLVTQTASKYLISNFPYWIDTFQNPYSEV